MKYYSVAKASNTQTFYLRLLEPAVEKYLPKYVFYMCFYVLKPKKELGYTSEAQKRNLVTLLKVFFCNFHETA